MDRFTDFFLSEPFARECHCATGILESWYFAGALVVQMGVGGSLKREPEIFQKVFAMHLPVGFAN